MARVHTRAMPIERCSWRMVFCGSVWICRIETAGAVASRGSRMTPRLSRREGRKYPPASCDTCVAVLGLALTVKLKVSDEQGVAHRRRDAVACLLDRFGECHPGNSPAVSARRHRD